MYVGVDIGGTKTLVAALDEHGVIKQKIKFPTSKTYHHWLLELRHAAANFDNYDFRAGGVGVPGYVDRQHGRAFKFGNLAWKTIPIQRDLEKIFDCPIAVENDAKLAGLSEAMLLKDEFRKVLYVTISTGIGYGLTVDGVIDISVSDAGGHSMVIEHRGKHVGWEDVSSGRAIVEHYGKLAADITDKATWQQITRDMAKGFIELIAITEPEVIVVGGGVGAFFDRFGDMLADEIKSYHLPIVSSPRLRGAQRPEEAVVFGCYDLAKQRFSHAVAHR